jgi:hypothetical protein
VADDDQVNWPVTRPVLPADGHSDEFMIWREDGTWEWQKTGLPDAMALARQIDAELDAMIRADEDRLLELLQRCRRQQQRRNRRRALLASWAYAARHLGGPHA